MEGEENASSFIVRLLWENGENGDGGQGKDTVRDKNEIGIHSVRGGSIVGEQSVIFAGTDE